MTVQIGVDTDLHQKFEQLRKLKQDALVYENLLKPIQEQTDKLESEIRARCRMSGDSFVCGSYGLTRTQGKEQWVDGHFRKGAVRWNWTGV
mgnify:CR=1 FL=1